MKTLCLPEKIRKIPANFFLANVGLAVLLRKDSNIKHGFVPIRFCERYGGEPSVRLEKFGSKALELIKQLHQIQN
jgi:hypothetical protein